MKGLIGLLIVIGSIVLTTLSAISLGNATYKINYFDNCMMPMENQIKADKMAIDAFKSQPLTPASVKEIDEKIINIGICSALEVPYKQAQNPYYIKQGYSIALLVVGVLSLIIEGIILPE